MALTDLNTYRVAAGLGTLTPTQENQINALCGAADAAVKSWLRAGYGKQTFPNWPEASSGTLFLSGSGRPILQLPILPVSAITSIYEDYTGYAGQGTNAFAAGTLLTAGTHYYLDLDDGIYSSTGHVVRISGGAGLLGNLGWFLSDDYFPGGRNSSLAARPRACWPAIPGCLKVTFTAGLTVVPNDLVTATNEVVSWLRRNLPYGGNLQGEHLIDFAYQMSQKALLTTEIGEVSQLLSSYRLKNPF